MIRELRFLWAAVAVSIPSAVVTTISTPASATVMLYQSTVDMAKAADAIVIGTVKERSSQWGSDEFGNRIYTFTRISVERTLKGKPVGEIVIRQWGGTVGEVTMKVPGNAEFAVDERVVLFASAGRGGLYHLPALAASKFSVRFESGATYLVRSLEGISFAAKDKVRGFTILSDRFAYTRVSWDEFARAVAAAGSDVVKGESKAAVQE